MLLNQKEREKEMQTHTRLGDVIVFATFIFTVRIDRIYLQ